MEKTDKQKESESRQQSPLKNYAKYSSLAFQMLGAIAFGTWCGYWLDGQFSNRVPIFTLLGAMLSLAAVIFWLLKISRES